jgi:uncharacterized protein YcgI (DUF1989 family)
MTDGDFFIQINIDGKVETVAYIEEIQVFDVDAAQFGDYPIWPSKDALCREIMKRMAIQSFIVYHNPQCTDFLVFNFENSSYKRMREDHYKSFEINLRRVRLRDAQKAKEDSVNVQV